MSQNVQTHTHTLQLYDIFCVEVGYTMVLCTQSETDDARFYADIELDVLADY